MHSLSVSSPAQHSKPAPSVSTRHIHLPSSQIPSESWQSSSTKSMSSGSSVLPSQSLSAPSHTSAVGPRLPRHSPHTAWPVSVSGTSQDLKPCWHSPSSGSEHESVSMHPPHGRYRSSSVNRSQSLSNPSHTSVVALFGHTTLPSTHTHLSPQLLQSSPSNTSVSERSGSSVRSVSSTSVSPSQSSSSPLQTSKAGATSP